MDPYYTKNFGFSWGNSHPKPPGVSKENKIYGLKQEDYI